MRQVMAIAALALAFGCGPAADPGGGPEAAPGAATCADGSARLAVTGLCQDEARALLAIDPGLRTPELEGCAWAVNETALPDGALLYLAATCGGVQTTLAFAGGARRAELSYGRSAMLGEAAAGQTLIHLYGTDPDPQGALKAAIAEAPAAERAGCEIRPAEIETWPADALLIAPNAAARAKLPADKPVIACGPLGVDETQARYWRVRQGFAWFFDLGAREPDFDPASMTIVAQGEDGAWRAKP